MHEVCATPQKTSAQRDSHSRHTAIIYMYVKMQPLGLSSKPLKGINVGKAGLLTYRPV